MVKSRLIFNQVSLSVHETDLPDEAGILGNKSTWTFSRLCQGDNQDYRRF